MSAYRASPAIFSVNLSTFIEQQSDDVCVALAGGDMKSSPVINIPKIYINTRIQDLPDPIQIPFISQVHQPHSRVNPLQFHTQFRILPLPLRC